MAETEFAATAEGQLKEATVETLTGINDGYLGRVDNGKSWLPKGQTSGTGVSGLSQPTSRQFTDQDSGSRRDEGYFIVRQGYRGKL